MKAYSGHIGSSPDPAEAGEPSYADEAARSNDALAKFTVVADNYPSTSPGRLARYYAALCLEDLDKENQALEELKKISNGSDKELASMAQYQTAVLYSRTGKADHAGDDAGIRQRTALELGQDGFPPAFLDLVAEVETFDVGPVLLEHRLLVLVGFLLVVER